MSDVQVGIRDERQGFDEDKFVKLFEERFKRSKKAFEDWRASSLLYYDSYAGDPWPREAKDALDAEGRPHISFNYALGTINAVLGQEQSDRKEPRFLGVQGDAKDEFVGDCYTKVVRHVYQKTRAHSIDSMAELDQFVTGYGWTEGFVNVNRFPTRIEAGYVDCLEMYPDPDCQLDNLTDARYLIRARRWLLEDAIDRWPDKEDELRSLGARGTDAAGTEPIHPTSGQGSAYLMPETAPDPFQTEDRVYIFDYQLRKKEKWVAFVHPITRARMQLPKSDFTKLWKEVQTQINPATGQPVVASVETFEFSRDTPYRAFLAGTVSSQAIVLEEPKRIETDSFTYQCATGYRTIDHRTKRRRHFGLAAVLYEPQLWSAKALSSAIEYIARGVKQPWVVADGTFEDLEEVTEKRSQMAPVIGANAGVDIARSIFSPQGPMWHQGYGEVLNIATGAVPATTNVTDAKKGAIKNARSERLVSNLQAHSDQVLNPLLEPTTGMRTQQALLIAKLVQKFMPRDDFNRVVGSDGAEGVTYEVPIDALGMPQKDPRTGKPVQQPILIPDLDADGKPIVDPQTGQAGQRPVTPWDLCQDSEIFEFTVEVDMGTASVTAKQAIWSLLTDTAALQDLIQDPQVRAIILPLLFRNIPGFPVEQSKEIASTLDRVLQQQLDAGTMQGVVEGIQKLRPDELAQVDQMVQAAMQQQGLPPGGAPTATPNQPASPQGPPQ